MRPSPADEPPSDSDPHGTEWSRRAWAAHRERANEPPFISDEADGVAWTPGPLYRKCDDPDCGYHYAYDAEYGQPHFHFTGPPAPEPSRWTDL